VKATERVRGSRVGKERSAATKSGPSHWVAAAVTLGGGILGAVLGGRLLADRLRNHTVPELEPLLETPRGLRHHRVETADGAQLHLAEAGEGTPVLLLHGVTLQWWVWNSLFHLLSDRYRVIAWDMRGHGESTVGADGMSLSTIAGDIALVVNELELDGVIIVGHSMGGMAMLEFCERSLGTNPAVPLNHSVAALVPLATSGDVLPDSIDAGSSQILGAVVGGGSPQASGSSRSKGISGIGAMTHPHIGLLLSRLAFGAHPSGTAVEQVRRMGATMSASVTKRAVHAISKHGTNDSLRGVQQPTIVVVGDRDLLTPPIHAKKLMRSFDHVELRVLHGVGHQVMQEDPWSLAAAIGAAGGADAGARIELGKTRRKRRRISA
jgi:pimeloyl-ACP methyl ester carboxylesterase